MPDMKQTILLTLIATIAITFTSFAQTSKEIKQSDSRIAKMVKLTPSKPCGIKSIDDAITAFIEMVPNAVEISASLKTMGQNPDRVAKQTIKSRIDKELATLEAMDVANVFQRALREVEAMPEEEQEKLSMSDYFASLIYLKKLLELLGPEIEYHRTVAAEIK